MKLIAASELIPLVINEYPEHEKKLLLYRDEITKAKRVVELIQRQKPLQTSGVVASIRQLQSIGEVIGEELQNLGENGKTLCVNDY